RRLPGRAVGGPAPGAGRDRRGRPLRGLIGSDVGLGPTRLVVPGTTKWLQRAGLMPRGASTMTMEPCATFGRARIGRPWCRHPVRGAGLVFLAQHLPEAVQPPGLRLE